MLALLNGRGMCLIPVNSQPTKAVAVRRERPKNSLHLSTHRDVELICKALQEAPISVRHIFLDNCNLRRVPEALRRFKKIETLSLRGNPRILLFPSWFAEFCKKVTTLLLPSGEACRNRKRVGQVVFGLVAGAEQRERNRRAALYFLFAHKEKQLGLLNVLNRNTITDIAKLVYQDQWLNIERRFERVR